MTLTVDEAFENLEWEPGYLENIASRILHAGEIPNHIGIIMDGNRRWAKERDSKPIDGHLEGARALIKVCQFAESLGVKTITAFALSTDNLKRSKEEVQGLFDLLYVFCKKQFSTIDVYHERGVRINFIGDIELLPEKLSSLAAKLMLMTKENYSLRLNLAVCYKSTEEIERTLKILKKAVNSGEILLDDIDENLVENCFYTSKSQPVDFLIRTSGEQRFSDFLLWQANSVPLYFCDVMWPNFTFYNFCKAILNYQRSLPRVQVAKLKHLKSEDNYLSKDEQQLKQERIRSFLDKEEQKFMCMLEEMAADAHKYL